jgi:hypothetical protein
MSYSFYKIEDPKFLLIIGDNSESIFEFMCAKELAGLKRDDCYDKTDDSFIAGLVNDMPIFHPLNKYNRFIFLNRKRLDTGLIVHECVHLSKLIMNSDIYDCNEEEFAELTEKLFNKIIDIIKVNRKLIL